MNPSPDGGACDFESLDHAWCPPAEASLGSERLLGDETTSLHFNLSLGLRGMQSAARNADLRRMRDQCYWHFRKTDKDADIDAAVLAAEAILPLPNNAWLALDLNILAFIKTMRFQIFEKPDPKDIHEAVELRRRAKRLCQQGWPLWQEVVSDLGYSLGVRHSSQRLGIGGSLDDLNDVVLCSQEVMSQLSAARFPYHDAFVNISNRLANRKRYDRSKLVGHGLIKSVARCLQEHMLSGKDSEQTLLGKYSQTGYWRDLDEVIQRKRMDVRNARHNSMMLSKACVGLAVLLSTRYERTRKQEDLQEAVRYHHKAVVATPSEQPPNAARGRYLLGYMMELKNLMRVVHESAELNAAISEATGIITAMPPGYDQEVQVLYQLGQIISRKYEVCVQSVDLVFLVHLALRLCPLVRTTQAAAQVKVETAALVTLVTHATKLAISSQDNYIVLQIAKSMHREYCSLIANGKTFIESLVILQKDVVINTEVVGRTWKEKPQEVLSREVSAQIDFAMSLGTKTVQFRVKILDLKLSTDRSGSLREKQESELASSLNGLELSGGGRFSEDEMMKLLQSAKQMYYQACDSNNVGPAIQRLTHIETTGVLDKTEDAVLLLEMTGDLLLRSFEATACLEDLRLASFKAKESLMRSPDADHTSSQSGSIRCRFLCKLCGKLRSTYLKRREEEWLLDAFVIGSAAVRITSALYPGPSKGDDHLAKNVALHNFANVLKTRYQLHGNFDDLENAIKHSQQAMALDRENPLAKRQHKMSGTNQHALMMRLRYRETGEMTNLNAGIKMIEDFLQGELGALFPPICGAYTSLQERDEKGIADLLPEDENMGTASVEGDNRILIGNLGMLYQTKCEQTGHLSDADNAILHCTRAMEMLSEDDAATRVIMTNLANAYLERHFCTFDMQALLSASSYAKKAAHTSLVADDRNPEVLADGATILRISYNRNGDTRDLEQAKTWIRKAISLLGPGSTSMAMALYECGLILEQELAARPSQSILEECINVYGRAATIKTTGRKGDRETSACRLYRLLITHNRWDEALAQLEALVESMDRRCPRWLPSSDRQYLLSKFDGVPSDTAATILRSSSPGSAYRALLALEHSRGVFLGSILDLRREVKHANQAHKELIIQWNRHCMELDASMQEAVREQDPAHLQVVKEELVKTIAAIRSKPRFGRFTPPLDLGSMLAYEMRQEWPILFGKFNSLQREYNALSAQKDGRHTRQNELSDRMDAMVAEMRRIPGLDNILLPPTIEKVKSLARDSSIVIFATSEIVKRSDAILVTEAGVESLHLPLLHYDDARHHMQQQRDALTGWTARNQAQKNSLMRESLLWLWTCAVEPVLKRLNIDETSTRKRIHWIGTGILSTAPFHAAGNHGDGSTENTISRAISSYIPTLRALSFVRDEPSPEQFHNLRDEKRVLLVSVPNAPGSTRLRAVEEEVAAIAQIAQPHATVVQLKAPGPAAVMRELCSSHIVHLACHAAPDTTDLNESHLKLMPDSTLADPPDQQPQIAGKLTVRHIRARPFASAQLAYLSACSAAENCGILTDESIHIASAFQLAGFRHVVGTLWQAKDHRCREVAECFYATLFTTDAGKGKELRAPQALDEAVRRLRDKNPARVLDWAPFVHIGA